MIDQALRFVVERLNDHLGVDPPEVESGHVPDVRQAPSASSGHSGGKVIASVVQIRLDHALRNSPPGFAPRLDVAGMPERGQISPVHEILILFSAFKSPEHYELALRRISQIIEFFHHHPVFSAEVHSGLRTAGIRKLSFSFEPVTIEQSYQIWSINGGSYLPSVLYNMKIDLNESGHAV